MTRGPRKRRRPDEEPEFGGRVGDQLRASGEFAAPVLPPDPDDAPAAPAPGWLEETSSSRVSRPTAAATSGSRSRATTSRPRCSAARYAATPATTGASAIAYPPPMQGLTHPHYYDYNTTFPANPNPGASTSTFRPAKRPRPLTEEEAAAITRNFTRGDFFVGSSAPVRIDPRLPVRLTLAEGDQVHFSIGEAIV